MSMAGMYKKSDDGDAALPVAMAAPESLPLLHARSDESGFPDGGPSKGRSSSMDKDGSGGGGDGQQPELSLIGCLTAHCCFCVPYSWIARQHPDQGKRASEALTHGINGPIATFFLLLNSMIGSGIFVQPYVFKEVGIFLAPVIYCVVGTAIFTGVDLLMRSADKYQIFDYSKLATTVMGPLGQQFVDTIIVIGNFGSLVSYLLIIGSLVNDIVEQYTGFSSVTLMTVLVTTFLVVPGCLIRVFGKLSVFAYFSMAAIFGTFLFVVTAGPIETRGEISLSELNYWSVFQGFKHIGNVVFALGFSNSVFHAFVSIKDVDRTAHNFSFISFATISFGLVICISFGIIGYFSFGDDTESNILLNFSGNLGAIFKVIVVIHLLLYLPGDFIVMRFSFFRLLGFHVDDISDDTYIVGTLLTLFFTLGLVCTLEVFASQSSLTYSLDLTGGIANSLTFFFFPGLIALYCHTYAAEPKVCIKAMLLCIFGLALPIIVTISIFVSSDEQRRR